MGDSAIITVWVANDIYIYHSIEEGNTTCKCIEHHSWCTEPVRGILLQRANCSCTVQSILRGAGSQLFYTAVPNHAISSTTLPVNITTVFSLKL